MRILFYIFISIFIAGIDLYTKELIVQLIPLNSSIPVIGNFFSITYVQNFGAGFSIMQNQQLILILVSIIAIGILFFQLVRKPNNNILFKISSLLIIGGALGNLIDRIKLSYVVDFLDFKFGSYHFPTFNIADTFLTIGVFLLLIYLIFIEKKDNEKNKSNS